MKCCRRQFWVTGQTLDCPSLIVTKCLNTDDKFLDSDSDAVLQTDLGCVSVLPIIQFTYSAFFLSAPLWWDRAGLTECSLI